MSSDENFKNGPLAHSKHANYLESLTPEQAARRYFVKGNGKKYIDEIGDAKRVEINNVPKYKYASNFTGTNSDFFNGTFVYHLEDVLSPDLNIRINVNSLAEDLNKFLEENEDALIETTVNLIDINDYVVDFTQQILKTCGKGLQYIRKNAKGLSV